MTVAAYILAAGASERFGSAKALAILPDGKTLLEHTAAMLRPLVLSGVYVIEGAHPLAVPTGSEVLHHVDWRLGMESSVRFAVHSFLKQKTADWLLLLPVDMPGLNTSHYEALIQSAGQPGKLWAATGYKDSREAGIPVLWSAAFCKTVLEDSLSPRKMMEISRERGSVVFCEQDLHDIDTPPDLAAFIQKHHVPD
jgi:CTP:molybdopterin cytidylyltransferase MocA